jgi:rare lipoprotein A
MRTILTLFLLFSPLEAFAHSFDFQKGTASYYSRYEDGRRTADGERYSPYRYTAASRTLKLGSIIEVVNARNDRRVFLKVNDRGPYVGYRILDVSWIAARELGMLRTGTTQVKVYVLRDSHSRARRHHEERRMTPHRWIINHRSTHDRVSSN